MAKIQVILTETVKGQGKKGEVISVSEGYAKNFLFTQKKGILATPEELKKLEVKAAKKEKQAEKEKENAEENKKLIESKTVEITVKTGSNGKVFGAVTSKEVAELIEKSTGLKIDKKKINANFKTVGEHIAEIKLHTKVKAELKVIVKG